MCGQRMGDGSSALLALLFSCMLLQVGLKVDRYGIRLGQPRPAYAFVLRFLTFLFWDSLSKFGNWLGWTGSAFANIYDFWNPI